MAKLNSPLLKLPKSPKNTRQQKENSKTTDEEVLDEDGVFKQFFTQNALDVIALIKPDLYAAIDVSVPIEFCEQELINFLRGRLRQPDKRKVVDKLLKVKLLTGEDHFIFFHNEFQNALLDELAFRWFKSRMLIALRYNTEEITTLVIFTGKAPSKKHFVYDITRFGTRTLFVVNAFAVISQNAKWLAETSNPVGLAFLAAKYAAQSKGDDAKRLKLKKKVLALVQKKGLHLGKMRIILNFVFDFMLLPDKMDEELKLDIPFFTSSKSEKNMVLTKNFIDIRNASSLNDTGLTFEEFFYVKNQEVEKAKAEAKAEAEKAIKEAIKEAKAEAIKEAKAEAIKEAEAKAEAIKEAEAKAIKETKAEAKAEAETKAIKSIHEMIKEGFSFEKIAGLLGLDVNYVKQLARISQSN
jgi:hypothetical protein